MALRWIFPGWAAVALWSYLGGHPSLWNGDWIAKAFLPPCPPWDAPFLLDRAAQKAGALGIVLLFLLGARAVGGRLSNWLRLHRPGTLVTLLLGWGTLSLCWLGAGLGAVWFTLVAWAVLIAGAVAGGRALPGWIASVRRESGWWVLAAVPAAYVTLAGALAPETELDAVRYHLGLPATFIAHHRIFVPEWMMFASFPLNASMAFGSVMLAGGQSAAKLLNWSLLWIIAGLALRLAGGGTAGRLAALLWVSIPVVLVHAAMGFAELTATAFLTAALLLVREPGGRHRIASALLAGFALGTTYRAVHGVVPLTILWWLAGRRWRSGSGFAATSLIPVLPWLTKNWLVAGNPVHPILADRLGSVENESAALAQSVFRMADLIPGDGMPFGGIWHLLVTGDRTGSYPLGPAIAVILPLVVVGMLGPARRLATFALLYVAGWLATTPGWGRYLLGAFPAGCAAAAVVAVSVTGAVRRVATGLLVALLASTALLGGIVLFRRHFPVPHAWGCESSTEYLAGRIAPAPHGAAMFRLVEQRVPAGDRLYLWGMVTTAFSSRQGHADYEHSTPLFQSIVHASGDPDRVGVKFRQRRWRAFLHDLSGGVSQSASADLLPWTPRMVTTWQSFVRRSFVLTDRIERDSDNVYLHLYTVRTTPRPSTSLPRGATWPHLPGLERVLVPGDIAYDAKDLRRALALYESAAADYPGYAWARQRIADVAKELGRKR